MLNIGGLKLDLPFFQASLSGYSDMPMRVLARKFGCPLTFSGVLLDKIALHPKAVNKLRFQTDDDIHPVGAQILGTEPEMMAAAAKGFRSIGYDMIDLNFACPAPKVLRRGRGGMMLTKPDKAIEIYEKVRDNVDCPVMMKLRIGFDDSPASNEDFWRLCENAARVEADAIVIHGRTVTQKYRGKADWKIVGDVKKEFESLTILGSGDIYEPVDAAEKMRKNHLDGFIVARGAIGNPWIFEQIKAMVENRPCPPLPTLKEQGEVMMEHFEMTLKIKPERKAVPYFRKFLAGYCKGHPHRKKVLLDLLSAKTAKALIEKISLWYESG